MKCPSCEKSLEIDVVDDQDIEIIMAAITCTSCPHLNVILTWPKQDKEGVIVVTESQVGGSI